VGELCTLIFDDNKLNLYAKKLTVDSLKKKQLDQYVYDNAVDLCETIALTDFPGAFIPIQNSSDCLDIVLVLPDLSSWYKLRPILKSYCGQSFSSFDGELTGPTFQSRILEWISKQNKGLIFCEISLIRGEMHLAALRILNRLVDSYQRRPRLEAEIPLPISFLLRNFEDALLIGDKAKASKIIETIQREFKLDRMNLKFMEIQMFARFGEWLNIAHHADLTDIANARKTPLILNYILTALRKVHLDKQADSDAQLGQYLQYVRKYTKNMFSSASIDEISPDNAGLVALEALVLGNEFTQFSELNKLLSHESAFRKPLEIYFEPKQTENEVRSSKQDALDALSKLAKIDSKNTLRSFKASFDKLGEADRETLIDVISFFDELEDLKDDGLMIPESWDEWFELLDKPQYDEYADHARAGAVQWEVLSKSLAREITPKIYHTISIAIDNAPTRTRIVESLPFIVKWLMANEEFFPERIMLDVYSGLLTLVALQDPTSSMEVLGSSQILVLAMISSGVDGSTYKQLLEDLDNIVGEGVGVSQVYWLLDLVEMLYEYPTSDEGIRNGFFHKVGGKITPIYRRLSEGQKQAVDILFDELGVNKPAIESAISSEKTNYWSKLDNKKIGIYTLTTTAGKRAAQLIKNLVPSAEVVVNSQHGGSDQLKALAENSDYFIISWLSAKHAATDFIRQHRSAEKIVYAQGKGASSIIRSLENVLTV